MAGVACIRQPLHNLMPDFRGCELSVSRASLRHFHPPARFSFTGAATPSEALQYSSDAPLIDRPDLWGFDVQSFLGYPEYRRPLPRGWQQIAFNCLLPCVFLEARLLLGH